MQATRTPIRPSVRKGGLLLSLVLLVLPLAGAIHDTPVTPGHLAATVRMAPVAVDDAFDVVEGTTFVSAAPGVLGNDTGATTASLVSGPTNGTLQLNPDGSFSYTHNGLNTTPDSFTYQASDGVGTDVATVSLTITSINFGVSALANHSANKPTSLQFGPDSLLYVQQKVGQTRIMKVVRDGPNAYRVEEEEVITLVRSVPNYNDDGTANPGLGNRQAAGLLVTGTASNPVVYVSSSDSRVGGNGGAADSGLDTNSGVISRLSWIGSSRTDPAGFWERVDIVRGLPRSEENHAVFGMALSVTGDTLYATVGGFTNAGAPSNNFAFITEYAFAAAIVGIDLPVINAMPTLTDARGAKYKYNMPTLDDPTRPNVNGITDPNAPGYDGIDVGDPWGGNDGLNQAKIVPGEPVFLHATGFRNPYDVIVTRTPGRAGRMYAIDNGANGGWGGHPVGEGMAGVCTNEYDPLEPGSSSAGPNDPQVNNKDNLDYIRELVPGERFYGGHPAPIRGNPAGAGLYTGDYNADPLLNTGVWRDGSDPNFPLPADWPPVPVEMANPVECDFRNPGETDGAIATFFVSTNGLTEYTASNFNNKFKGDLFAAGYNNNTIYYIDLNEAGDQVLNKHGAGNGTKAIFTNFGDIPLDVVAQGDNDPFPGTIWVADFASYDIWVFEPGDYDGATGGVCTGVSDPLLDEDGDGYDNEDEILNGSDPCSAASKPADNDGDLISDLLDPDDDNDGVLDIHDAFATDATNGMGLTLPVNYPLLNEDPGTGFFGVGFTGLMTNGVTDYLDQYEENNLVPGGTAGLFTVSAVSGGDATGATNTQENAFQFGVNVSGVSGPYTVKVRITGPFFDGVTPQDDQALGTYIGPGDMDNYVKVALNAQGGDGGLQVTHEAGGVATVTNYIASTAAAALNIDLLLTVDPIAGTIQPKYIQDGQTVIFLGLPIVASGSLLQAIQGTYQVAPGVPSGLAVGIISTTGAGPAFAATWDSIDIEQDANPIADSWYTYQAPTNPRQRHENTFVKHDDKFYLIGGRGSRRTDQFDPATGAWTQLTLPPIQMHHFQAVSIGDFVYVAGAYVGDFPSETPVSTIYTYAPNSDTWTVGATIPAARQRGSAGAVAYNGKLYIVSGSVGGHAGTAVHLPMFDQYDPATGGWTIMPDMPRGRDHFNAAIIGDKLYVAGGRAGGVGSTVPEVDVYDFIAGSWSTLPALTGNIPTPRGGTAAAAVGNDLFILGGESGLQQVAHSEVEVLDTSTNSWRTLDAMNTGRHGTAAVVDGTRVYIAVGSGETGGGPELATMEVFERTALSDPGAVVPSTLAADPVSLAFGFVQTGLEDAEMIALYNTGGNQDISISNLSLTGDAAFTLDHAFSLPAVIAPGDTLYADITFAPTSVGAANATLTVSHTGSNGAVNIAVSGDGVEGGGGVSTGNPIFRVNAGGGNFVDALMAWDRDTKNVPSPHVNASGNDNKTGKITTFTGVNATDAPVNVFLSNRWDPTGGVEMIWNFAAPQVGLYQVNLYFLESEASNHTVGGRVFDIKMEGAMVFEDFDIFAEAGANNAIKKSAIVNVTDGSITIELAHVIDNPVIHALEIRPVLGADLFASPATVDFFSVPVDAASAPMKVYFSNASASALTVTGVSIVGTNAAEFSHDFVGSVNLTSGATDSLNVVHTPAAEGVRTASLEIAHTGSGSPAVVALTGDGTNVHLSFVEVTIIGGGIVTKTPDKPLYSDGEVVTLTAVPDPGWQFSAWSGDIVSPDNPVNYLVFTDAMITATFIESATTIDPLFRVNAGNGSISDTPIVWERDTKNKPAPYNNAATGGDNSISKAAFVGSNTTDAPSEIFGSNRWDPVGGTEMEWNFPVGLAGDYEVNLYFAETGSNTNDIGDRVFDVVIENNLVLNDYDVVADVGYQTAVKKSFIVSVSDGNIDINFLRVVENPFVSGIEIVPTPATVPLNARYNGVDNTFIVRRYQQVLDGSWALVGLPLVSEANAVETFAADEVLQYVDGKYAPTTAMVGGRGYWARAEEEQLSTLQGERLDTMTVALKAGWNMIAGTSCDLDLNLMAGAEHIVPNSLYRYDTDSGYQPTDRLQQGRGYWVRAKEAGALRFDCSNTSSFRLPNEPIDLGAFGRVAIGDEEGRLQTLHFGGELEDALLAQYGMPPLAPGAAFDIRYADQSRVSKTTSNVVQLQHVAFPLTLRMEALPEGGHDNEYVVSRMRNGAEVETFRVRLGGTLEIEDAETDALMIQSLSEWQSELPDAFGLKGNYPNPFNPTTQIVFDLPEAADVSIEVFDLLGRRVRQIHAVKLAAGQSRQIEMDGRGLASGVYLYRVEAVMPAQTVSGTGKMILVK